MQADNQHPCWHTGQAWAAGGPQFGHLAAGSVGVGAGGGNGGAGLGQRIGHNGQAGANLSVFVKNTLNSLVTSLCTVFSWFQVLDLLPLQSVEQLFLRDVLAT